MAVAPHDLCSAAWSQKEHSSIYEGDSIVCGRILSMAYDGKNHVSRPGPQHGLWAHPLIILLLGDVPQLKRRLL